ncbi:MAG: TolC family protein [Bacteroidetes bacterium]|nr:TolC family protein [Bacteroidota bacterium]
MDRITIRVVKSLILLQGVFLLAGMLLAGIPAQAQELSLREALEQAIERNALLRSVDAQYRATEAQVRETRSGHLPRITASTSYTWHQEPNIVFPIHQAGVFPPLDDQIFESNLQLTLPIYSGGRTSALTEAAEAGTAQSQAKRHALRTEILEQVTMLYMKTAELQDKQQLITSRMNALRRRHFELDVLLREGRATEAHIALVTAEIASSAADSIDVRLREEEAAWRLGQLVGSNEQVIPNVRGLQLDTETIIPPSNPAFENVLALNDDVNAARARVRQSEANERLARRSFLPELSGFAGYAYRSGGSAWDPDGEWMAGVRLSIPLLDGGRRFAQVSMTKEQSLAAEHNLRSVEQQSHAMWRIALDQWKAARAQLRSAGEAAQRKQISLEAQEQLFEAGRLPLHELMTQETELLQLRLREKTYHYATVTAAVHYHAVNGTLSQESIEQMLGVSR